MTETVKAKPKPAPQPARRFTGNGSKTFRVRVPKDSMLGWRNDGEIFQVWDEGFTWLGVNSQAHRGNTFLPAGRYTLTVNAIGNWTITIR